MIKNRMSVFFLLSISQSFNIDSRRTISDRAYRSAVTFGFRVHKFCLCRQSLRRSPCWRLIHMTSAYRRYASTSSGPWGDNHGVCPVHGCQLTKRRSSLGPARHLKQSRTKSSARYSHKCEQSFIAQARENATWFAGKCTTDWVIFRQQSKHRQGIWLHWIIYQLINWLIDWLIDWLIELRGWLNAWTDWLIELIDR